MQDLFVGWHLIYDGIVHPEHAHLLKDLPFLEETFLELTTTLGLCLLKAPVFEGWWLQDTSLDSNSMEGFTGTLMLMRSHLIIHTWPTVGKFSLDIFSYKEFNKETFQHFVTERFQVKKRSLYWIRRQWP